MYARIVLAYMYARNVLAYMCACIVLAYIYVVVHFLMLYCLAHQDGDAGDSIGEASTSEGTKRVSEAMDQPEDIENVVGEGRKKAAVQLPFVTKHRSTTLPSPSRAPPPQSWRTVLGPPPPRGTTQVGCRLKSVQGFVFPNDAHFVPFSLRFERQNMV